MGDPKFDAKVRWFLDRLDAPPVALHRRGVWSDSNDGSGSVLGSPAVNREFAAWLERPEHATITERLTVSCSHPGMSAGAMADGAVCLACATHDAHGLPVASTGRREIVSHRYRWPMRAALSALARLPVRRGRPDLRETLLAFAAVGGDERRASDALALRFPAVTDPKVMHAHVSLALNELRGRYVEDVPATRSGRSEAQFDAEAAA